MSARPFQSSRSYGSLPSSTVRTAFGGHFSARNLRASSRSCFCSSEKSKFMACYPFIGGHSGAREARTRNLDLVTSGFRIGPKTDRPERHSDKVPANGGAAQAIAAPSGGRRRGG